MTGTSERVEWVRPSDGVAEIVICNEARRNALTFAMWQDLARVTRELRADHSIRVVVLRGAGEVAFSAGADITEFEALRTDEAAVARYNAAIVAGMQGVRDLQVPVIAQIHGSCIGGGLALALMCDLRFMEEGGRIGIPAAKLGVAYQPDWVKRLVEVVGSGPAGQILYTAETFPIETVRGWNFATDVLAKGELAAHVDALKMRIARLSPLSLRASKISIRQSLAFEPDRDWQAALAATRACDRSADYGRGVAAYRAGTTPEFQGN